MIQVSGPEEYNYDTLSHAIENTANQKADPLHILWYATGSIPRKNPAFLAGYNPFVERLLFI